MVHDAVIDSGLHSRAGREPLVVACANRIFRWLERVSRRRTAVCLLVVLLTIGTRLMLLPRLPIPHPFVADEFSYILGAETFASGRMTNPTHPMWVHFETLHDLMRPTYMTKYPPGQSLFLALGLRLFGNAWFGVLISFGLFAGALCWMLQKWVPPVYALLGTAITLARVSILGYWMNSYWGGAVAGMAGCVVLGTIPLLARRVKLRDAALLALGLVILANTRPFEGLVMSLAAGVGLVFLRARNGTLKELLSPKIALPLVLICGSGVLLDGYYNFRVTGNALVMPYTAYSRSYASHPPWIFAALPKFPDYRHPELANSWRNELNHFLRVRSSPSLNLTELEEIFEFYGSALWLFPSAVGLLLSRNRGLRVSFAIYACAWLALAAEGVKAPHYIAGAVGLLPLMTVFGFRSIKAVSGRYGAVLTLLLASLLCVQGVTARGNEKERSWQTRPRGYVSSRMIATSGVEKAGGRHLILVRYAADHIDKSDDCVYNDADIDKSPIVWAHDMGEAENREIVGYFSDRKAWLFEPDADPKRLRPYSAPY